MKGQTPRESVFARALTAQPPATRSDRSTGVVDACGDGGCKAARAGLHGNVQHHTAEMVTAFQHRAFLQGFEIGDDTAHDFLTRNDWNVEDSISEWTNMMIGS